MITRRRRHTETLSVVIINHPHTQMLRLIAGVPATACADLLFTELGLRHLESTWKRTVCFWNNLASLPCSSLHYQVAVHNCRLAVAGGSRNWAFGVMMGLCRIGYSFTIRCDRLDPIDWSVFRSCLDCQAEGAWMGLHLSPRLCPSLRAQGCVPMPGGLPNPPMPRGTRPSFGSQLVLASCGPSYVSG
jgi:hypothetical protein